MFSISSIKLSIPTIIINISTRHPSPRTDVFLSRQKIFPRGSGTPWRERRQLRAHVLIQLNQLRGETGHYCLPPSPDRGRERNQIMAYVYYLLKIRTNRERIKIILLFRARSSIRMTSYKTLVLWTDVTCSKSFFTKLFYVTSLIW